MKQAIALLFISLFAFQLGGWIIPFHLRQCHIRHEIKQRIKKGVAQNDLISIQASPGNLEKMEWKDEHEFRLDGEMYDIVSTGISDGQLVYQCINDKQEQKLFSQLDQLVKRQLEQESGKYSLGKLAKSISPFILSEHNRILNRPVLIQIHGVIIPAYHSPVIHTFSPPPDFV